MEMAMAVAGLGAAGVPDRPTTFWMPAQAPPSRQTRTRGRATSLPLVIAAPSCAVYSPAVCGLRPRPYRACEDFPLVAWVALPQNDAEIVGMLPEPPDRGQLLGRLSRSLQAEQLLPNFPLLALKLLDHLLYKERFDAGSDAPQLGVL